MELILSFKHLPFIEKGATYEIGNGKSHSLSFYFLGANHRILVDNQVMFADVIKCVDDVEDIYLKESEYDISDSSYSYIFSDVISRDLNDVYDESNIISFYANRRRKAGIESYVFNVFNEGRRRKTVEYDMYRLKEKYDNGAIRNEIVEIFKDEKSTIENDGGGFVEDKESEDGVLENGFINIVKTNNVVDKLEDTLARKTTDYGVTENIIVKFDTEIKDLLYDKFQKMLGSIDNEIIVNQTMLVDMGNYRELLQNQYVMITTPDSETHKFENEYLRSSDSILDKPGIGSMLGGNENDLLVDDYWKLYGQDNNELYIDKLDKKLSQDIYSKPILNFDAIVLDKDNLKLYNEQDYFELYKDDTNVNYQDTISNWLYRESSDTVLRDDYLFLLKGVQNLFVNKENIQAAKTDGEAYKFNTNEFGRVQNREAYLIENKVFKKMVNTVSIKQTEEFLFHPLDGVYFVDTSKWFDYEKTLYQEYSGLMAYGNDKKAYLNGYGEFVGEIDDDFKLYILNNFSISGRDKLGDVINNLSISGEDKLGDIEKITKAATKFDKGLIVNDGVGPVGSYGGELDILSEMMLGKYNKDINLDYGQLLIEKYYHRIVDGFENIFFRVTQRYTDARKDDIWSHKKIREMYNNTSVIMMNRDRRYLYINKDISVNDTFREIFKYDISTFAYVASKYVNLSATDIFVDTISKSIKEELYIMQLYKIEKGLASSFEEVQFSRSSYKFNVNTDFIWLNKESDGFEMNEHYSVEASKESRKVIVDNYLFINSPSYNNRELNIDYDYTMVSEYPRDTIYNINGVWANRTVYDVSTKDTYDNIYRINNNIEATNTILGVFKESRRIDSDSRSTQVYKEEKDIFTDFIEEFLHRDFIKEINFNEDIWMGAYYKETNNVNDYMVNLKKVDKDMFKNDTDISIVNQYRPIFKLNEDNMFDISEKEMFSNNPIIQFSKRYIKLFEDKYVIVDKVKPSISLSENDQKRVSRETYSIMSNNSFRWVHKVIRDSYINDVTGANVALSDKGALYYDTEAFVNKDIYKMDVNSNAIFAGVDNKSIHEDYNTLNVSKFDYSVNGDLGYIGVGKYSRGINKDESSVRVSKISIEISSILEPITADKIEPEIGSIDTYLFVGKLINEIIKPSEGTFANKAHGTIRHNENGLFANSISKGTMINNTWELTSRADIKIDISKDIDFILKQAMDMNIGHSEIEVKKKAKDIYVDTVSNFIHREFLNKIRFNKDLWTSHVSKSLYNVNDHVMYLKKVDKDTIRNDTGIHISNQYRPVYELNYNNMFDISERKMFNKDTAIQLHKEYIEIFEDKYIMVNKINPKISLAENSPKRISRETYGIMNYDNFRWVYKTLRDTYINDVTSAWMGLSDKGVLYYDTELVVDKNLYEMSVDSNVTLVGIGNRNIYKDYNILNVSKTDYGVNPDLGYIGIIKHGRGICENEDPVRISKILRETSSLSTPITADKIKAEIGSVNDYLFVGKLLNEIIKPTQDTFVNKVSGIINYNKNGLFARNISKGIITNNTWEMASRANIAIDISKDIDFISKQKSNINVGSSEIEVKKNAKDMYIDTLADFIHREFLKETNIDKDLWFKYEYKSIEDSNNYIVNLEKLKAIIHKDDTITRVHNSDKEILEDKGYNSVGVYERELLENEISTELSKKDINILKNNILMVDKYKNKISLIENEPIRVTRESYSTSAKDSFKWISKNQIKTNISETTSVHGNIESRNTSYLEDMLRMKKYTYGAHTSDNGIFVRNNYRNTFVNKDILSVSKEMNYINIDSEHLLVNRASREIYANNSIVGVMQSSKSIATDSTLIGVAKEQSKIWLENSYLFMNGDPRRVNTLEQYLSIDKTSKSIGVTHDEIFVDKFSKSIFADTSWKFASKSNRKTNIHESIDFAYKSSINISENKDNNFASKLNIDINKNKYIDFAYKLNANVFIDKGYDFVYKINGSVDTNESYDFVSKLSTRINPNNGHEFAYKVRNGISVNEIINFAYKSSKKLDVEYGGVTINKNQKETHINSHGEFLNRDFDWNGGVRLRAFLTNNFFAALGYKDIDLLYEPMTLNKGIKNVNSDSHDITVNKNKHKQSIGYDGLFIGKAVHNLDYILSNVEVSKYIKNTGVLDEYIGATKKRKDSSMNYNFEWISKGRKDGELRDHYTWISKGIKDTGVTYEFLTADKYNKETFINYSYYYADKYKKPTGIIDDDIYISKNGKAGDFNDFIYISKTYIEAYTVGNLFIDVNYKNMNFALKSDISISNKNNHFDFHGLLSLSQSRKYVDKIDNLSFSKYRSYGKILEQEFLYKPFFEGFIYENVAIQNSITDMGIDDNLHIDEYISNSYIFNNEWASPGRKKSNLTSTSETLKQETKEFQVEYQDLFVYHVAMDDGSKPSVERSGIIDELILPHKDYKYSDYLKKLILPDGSINMRYVKSFDADTGEYTVTIPIEHPLDVYTDVGRDYLDVDVAILDMTIHMLKEIWKQKMFRYVAMTAQDSLKDMLMELNKNIKSIYENDPAGKKEAIRCLQLFRWYSEMAILNNCEYILKFYGKEVEVDFVEKDLKEIENLIELNNMHVSDNFVLEPIDASKPASVLFNNNQKNLGAPLNISFKLYNVNRNSSISIDDENVENTNYKQGIHDVSIDIKKKAVISFEPNGEYQSMVIANLKATNYSTSDFSVKYKGVFGETNKVMQDLLDRVLVVGEVSDDLRERLGDVAPVTIALDKLLTYFELHHENKEKGRRLITRK